MNGPLSYIVFDTTLGWMAILGSDRGLVATSLPQRTEEHALMALGRGIGSAVPAAGEFDDLVERLRSYFAGYRVAFPDRLDLREATPFQRRVWEAARMIPYGETRGYGWIARYIGSPQAARAVGQALGKNPLPIVVPCHRVIASSGRLGGFTGGLRLKRRLLKLEGGSAG